MKTTAGKATTAQRGTRRNGLNRLPKMDPDPAARVQAVGDLMAAAVRLATGVLTWRQLKLILRTCLGKEIRRTTSRGLAQSDVMQVLSIGRDVKKEVVKAYDILNTVVETEGFLAVGPERVRPYEAVLAWVRDRSSEGKANQGVLFKLAASWYRKQFQADLDTLPSLDAIVAVMVDEGDISESGKGLRRRLRYIGLPVEDGDLLVQLRDLAELVRDADAISMEEAKEIFESRLGAATRGDPGPSSFDHALDLLLDNGIVALGPDGDLHEGGLPTAGTPRRQLRGVFLPGSADIL